MELAHEQVFDEFLGENQGKDQVVICLVEERGVTLV